MKVTAGAYSDRGGRSHNEDAFLCALYTGLGVKNTLAEYSSIVDASLFFLVADGMGGHDAGDAASAFVVEYILQAARMSANEGRVFNQASIETLVKSVHIALLVEGKEKGTPNMGTTLTGILLQKDAPCAFFNAGDSRVYRLRDGTLQQLTQDDSLANVMPGVSKHIITNAIGAGLQDVSIASQFSPEIASAGDIFLICSDGIHGSVSDDALEKFLAKTFPPLEIAKQIVQTAIDNDSDDNCTAVVVKLDNE